MRTISIIDYMQYKKGENWTPAVIAALSENKADVTLRFPKGEYKFWEEGSVQHKCIVTNNSGGVKNVIFPLLKSENIVIDGDGSDFIFHGNTFPFICDNAKGITLKNFNMDYDMPFHREFTVEECTTDYAVLSIDSEKYPVKVENEQLIFYSEYWQNNPEIAFLVTEYDPKTKAMQYGHGYYVKDQIPKVRQDERVKMSVEQIDKNMIKMTTKFDIPLVKGNVLTMQNEGRSNCGIFANRCEDVAVIDVNIYHCGGMGVVMQMVKNVTLERANITLRDFSLDRVVSITADATHFVHCMGKMSIKDCVFDNMLDDGTNVHGVYTVIKKKVSPNTVETKYEHMRVDIYNPGDKVIFIDKPTMQPMGEAIVKSVEDIDDFKSILVFEEDLPDNIKADVAIENRTNMPDFVHISGCRTGNNRPRGFLITTAGEVLIENNTFYNPDCGIEMAGDSNHWFESGAVENVTVRNNVFDNCGYSGGCPAIHICPQVKEGEKPFHKNVKIVGNEFRSFHNRVMFANHVENLTLQDNKFIKTDKYPDFDPNTPHTQIKNAPNRSIQLF